MKTTSLTNPLTLLTLEEDLLMSTNLLTRLVFALLHLSLAKDLPLMMLLHPELTFLMTNSIATHTCLTLKYLLLCTPLPGSRTAPSCIYRPLGHLSPRSAWHKTNLLSKVKVLNSDPVKASSSVLMPTREETKTLVSHCMRSKYIDTYTSIEFHSPSFGREPGFRLNKTDSQMPRLPRSHTPRVEPMIPVPHSRSISVVSTGTAHDEDISSLMIRGATDLRNAKFEIDEQVYPNKYYNRILSQYGCSVRKSPDCKAS